MLRTPDILFLSQGFSELLFDESYDEDLIGRRGELKTESVCVRERERERERV